MLDYGIFTNLLKWINTELMKKGLFSVDVKLDTNYAIPITTNAGLWRYKIGDTVKFTCLSPFKIIVSGRTKHYINVFGEEVIIENTDNVIVAYLQNII